MSLAGGAEVVVKQGRGGPSLRVLQGWALAVSLFQRQLAQFSQPENHFSQAPRVRLPVVPRTAACSTPLFSSLCKIFRTNDVRSLNTSTIIVFDKLYNSC